MCNIYLAHLCVSFTFLPWLFYGMGHKWWTWQYVCRCSRSLQSLAQRCLLSQYLRECHWEQFKCKESCYFNMACSIRLKFIFGDCLGIGASSRYWSHWDERKGSIVILNCQHRSANLRKQRWLLCLSSLFRKYLVDGIDMQYTVHADWLRMKCCPSGHVYVKCVNAMWMLEMKIICSQVKHEKLISQLASWISFASFVCL